MSPVSTSSNPSTTLLARSVIFVPKLFNSLPLSKINFKLLNMLWNPLHSLTQSFLQTSLQLSQIYLQEPVTTAFLCFFAHAVVSCLPQCSPFFFITVFHFGMCIPLPTTLQTLARITSPPSLPLPYLELISSWATLPFFSVALSRHLLHIAIIGWIIYISVSLSKL